MFLISSCPLSFFTFDTLAPAICISTAQTQLVDVSSKVVLFGPPKQRFAVVSGVRIFASRVPVGV